MTTPKASRTRARRARVPEQGREAAEPRNTAPLPQPFVHRRAALDLLEHIAKEPRIGYELFHAVTRVRSGLSIRECRPAVELLDELTTAVAAAHYVTPALRERSQAFRWHLILRPQAGAPTAAVRRTTDRTIRRGHLRLIRGGAAA